MLHKNQSASQNQNKDPFKQYADALRTAIADYNAQCTTAFAKKLQNNPMGAGDAALTASKDVSARINESACNSLLTSMTKILNFNLKNAASKQPSSAARDFSKEIADVKKNIAKMTSKISELQDLQTKVGQGEIFIKNLAASERLNDINNGARPLSDSKYMEMATKTADGYKQKISQLSSLQSSLSTDQQKLSQIQAEEAQATNLRATQDLFNYLTKLQNAAQTHKEYPAAQVQKAIDNCISNNLNMLIPEPLKTSGKNPSEQRKEVTHNLIDTALYEIDDMLIAKKILSQDELNNLGAGDPSQNSANQNTNTNLGDNAKKDDGDEQKQPQPVNHAAQSQQQPNMKGTYAAIAPTLSSSNSPPSSVYQNNNNAGADNSDSNQAGMSQSQSNPVNAPSQPSQSPVTTSASVNTVERQAGEDVEVASSSAPRRP